MKQPNQTENELSPNIPQDQEQKIDYTKYVPDVEFDDKIMGPVAEEVEYIKNEIENLVNDLTDLIQRRMFNSTGKQKPLEDAPLKKLAETGIYPRCLGKTTKKKTKFDEILAQWCRESNEKIPVAPLTIKEKELLQKTLVEKGLCEDDFVTMATREKLGSTNQMTPFHDERRPLLL